MRLKGVIENIAGLEEQTAAGDNSDSEKQTIAGLEGRNEDEHRDVAEEGHADLEPKCFAQNRRAGFCLIDKMPNDDAIESKGGEDGEDADEGETNCERTETLRPEMSTQQNGDECEGTDANNLSRKRPRAV